VRPVAVPAALVPGHALRAATGVVGRLLATPVRRGETLTDVRLLEPALLDAVGTDVVAVPVRVGDGAAAAALVHPGDRVDVLTVPDDGGLGAPVRTVATGVRVLAVPSHDAGRTDGGGLVVVAVTRAQAAVLARAATTGRFTLAVEHP
jgi:Flp pilus assembly protein CpaB